MPNKQKEPEMKPFWPFRKSYLTQIVEHLPDGKVLDAMVVTDIWFWESPALAVMKVQNLLQQCDNDIEVKSIKVL